MQVMNSMRNNRKRAGFTLIEMAVVIIILGVLAVAFTQVYAVRVKHLRMEDTKQDVNDVISAIASYRATFGRYPCPASLTIAAGDVDYGRESDCEDTTTIAVGACEEGICVQQSQLPAGMRVRVGSIPFRQLNLEEEQSLDGYGNRLRYVVTEPMAVALTFDAAGGGIAINNEQNVSVIEPADSAHFLVLSAGENGNGGFTRDGAQVACGTGTAESENCGITCVPSATPGNPPNCSIDAPAVYRAVQRSDGGTVDDFDDVVDYFVQAEIPLWQTAVANDSHIHQKPGGDVGFNLPSTAVTATRTVINGEVRAFDNPETLAPAIEGKIMVNNVCSDDGTDCFPVSVVSGPCSDPADVACQTLRCPDDQFMVGVSNGQAVCVPDITMECTDPGSFMTGVDPNTGELTCSVPQLCPSQNVGICGTTMVLTRSSVDTVQIVRAGTSREETYVCEGNLTWRLTGTTGSCTCTPGVVSTQTGRSCGTGYTGTYTSTTTRVCPAGSTTVTDNRATACVCATRPQGTDTQSCPSNQTGEIRRVRDWVCTGGTGAWGPWRVVSNTCACVTRFETRTQACPANHVGTGTPQRRDLQCPSGNWSAWTATAPTNCTFTCTTRTENRAGQCPSGQQGTVTQSRNYQCPAHTWTPWANSSVNCTPIPPRVCNWNAISSPQTGMATAGSGADLNDSCTCGDRGSCYTRRGPDNYTRYSTCACD